MPSVETPAGEFWRSTWAAWKNGALAASSSFYADSAKGSFEDFMRHYKDARDPRVNGFFAEHPPLPNEFFCAYMAEGSSTVLVMTNLRAWLLDRNNNRLLPFEFKDIVEFVSKATWSGRRVLVAYRDGTEAQYLLAASPTDEAAHAAIKSSAEIYGLPRTRSMRTADDVEPECVSCAVAGDHSVRYVACVSKTEYAGGNGDPYVAIDDAAVWGLRLCAACIPKVRMQHLRGSLESNVKNAAVGVFAVAVGFGAAFLAGQSERFSLPAGDNMLDGLIAALTSALGSFNFFDLAPLAVFVVVGLWVVLAGVAALVYSALSVVSAARLILAAAGPIPESDVGAVYVAAAEQVLKSRLEGSGKPRGPESRALPLRKWIDDLSEAELSKAQRHGHGQHVRSILPVSAETRDELVEKLPDEVRVFCSRL